MNRTLLQISDDMVALDQLLSERDGEIDFTIESWISELDLNLHNKADGYAALIQELERRVEVRTAEAERMKKLASIDDRNAQFLRSRLKDVMERHGVKKIETDRFRLSVVNNGGKQPMTINEPAVPESFVRYEPVIDKQAIRDRLEAGEELPFASLEPRGTRLSIR